ncbi:MAG: sulfatase [Lentisphaerales bacterium]|nr:sulfatase [Lentisphaerales bacterium]
MRFVAMVMLLFLASSQAEKKQNVLFISVDDLSNALACYGDLVAKPPHIDKLAGQGVLFERAYNQIPLCNPSRASVMTGMRPDQIKVYDLDRHFRDEMPNAVTLSQAFMKEGYLSARVGKIYHYNVPASIGTDGHDDAPSWQLKVNPKGRDKAEEHLIYNAEPHRKISAALSWLAADGKDEEQTDGMITTEAIKIMEKNKDKPFFLAVGFFRPHTPFVAPTKYFDMYLLDDMRLPYAPKGDRDDIPTAAFAHNCPIPHYNLDELTLRKSLQAYYACVSFIDAQVGRLTAALDRLGIAENTIVVFWSDHGYHLGEHNGVWQKRTLFEQGARAPLIIKAPNLKSGGQVNRRIVEFIDIYPTIVDLAGYKVAGNLPGRSMKKIMQNPQAEWDDFAITQILRPADSRLSTSVMGRSIRTARWRYNDWAEGAQGAELYDHYTDPKEFNNLAINPDENIKKIIKKLKAKMSSKASGKIPTTPFNQPRL